MTIPEVIPQLAQAERAGITPVLSINILEDTTHNKEHCHDTNIQSLDISL